MELLTALDLFCGAGGITEGFKQAGFKCLFANDVNEVALRTFKANHPGTWTTGAPIEELDPAEIRHGLGLSPGDLDCRAGGPPCQGFSINAPERFLDDPRNSLFKHYLRFVEEFRPKTLLFENVPGMLSLGEGWVVRQVMDSLASVGYDVSKRILFAPHYGVPQERWRLIILGSRLGPVPSHPQPKHFANGRANFTGGRTLTYKLTEAEGAELAPATTVREAIGDLPPLRAGDGSEEMAYSAPPLSEYSARLREGCDRVYNHIAPRIARVNLERLKYILPGGSWRDIPPHLLPAGMKRARRSDHTRRYGRLDPNGLAGTVMTKMDPHWGPAFHYDQDRTLTVREAARLQSFPDRYRFFGPRVTQYEQVGNAVPVLMAKAIAESIAQSLNDRPIIQGRLLESAAVYS
jgi:DNA (cytosine-5)-methyltransferase 1